MKPTIFFDSDGVVANFELHYADYFGHTHDSVSDDQMWKHINSYHDFFKNLPLIEGAKETIEKYRKTHQVIILTACPKSNYTHAALQKKLFFQEKFDRDLWVLPVLGGKNKALFMQKAGDVLVDDFAKNIKPWMELGGFGIVHKTWEKTNQELENYLK